MNQQDNIVDEEKIEEKKENKRSFCLEDECLRLLLAEPFFAALSRHINKTASSSIPTAGVRINKDSQSFELLYNPEFFESLTYVERLGVLKHEYYHLIFDHVTTRKPGDINEPGKALLWNYATDLAINSFLEKELPDICCFPGKGPFVNYPKGKNAEFYYRQIKQDKDFQQSNQSISIQFDSHEGWAKENGEEVDPDQAAANDMAKEKLRDILRKAVDECAQSSSWGTISSATKKDIIDRLKSTIDWRKVLRYFIKTSQRASKNNSIRKINKRYPYIHAGKKQLRQANIAISIDQSGSVSDDLLGAFFTELNKLSEIASFTVIPFDTQVAKDKVYIWKKGENRKCERVLNGGTDFDAPTSYVNNDSKFDGHIILTDLCAPKPKSSKCQRLWMTNLENAERPYFETNEIVIPITIKKEF